MTDSVTDSEPDPVEHPALAAYEARIRFPLDAFQRAACESLEEGRSVLVAAPTGAGKTAIAEFSVALARRERDARVFYTAPIKALSNQKFHELAQEYGEDQVGLLTGDVNIRGDAPIVVMTTEVLRNMIYADSTALADLAFVILDEVHFLGDRFRGAVWEEIILHLPCHVRLVSLSATVSNAEEFGDWMHAIRGDTDVIVSEHRPVPLYQHVLTKRALLPLIVDREGELSTHGRLNPEVIRLGGHGGSSERGGRGGFDDRGRRGRGGRQRGHAPQRHSTGRISRADIVRALDETELTPAIVFIFSRNGCDQAVRQALYEGIRLTTREERDEIRDVAQAAVAELSDEDLAVLGYHEWLSGLERGIAAHHAGLIPVFKSVVETLFQRRLVKAVFATETLALGINMPARSVVIEQLEKFNGERRAPLTTGEYTQLTGRAGRRGIDTEGHAVVVWSDAVDPEALAHLASKRSTPMKSSFRPTYNMSVNLLDRVGITAARSLLEQSFAQFQADRSVVDIARQVRAAEESLAGYESSMHCELGDFLEYAKLRRDLESIERGETAVRGAGGRRGSGSDRRERVSQLRRQLQQHPCASCPDLRAHERWAGRWFGLKRTTEQQVREIRSRTGTIARTFDRVVDLLLERGYLSRAVTASGESESITVEPWGAVLRRVYGERDLLVAECLRRASWNGIDAAGLAALSCALTYEPRRDDENADPELPRGSFREAFAQTLTIWAELDDLEERHRLPRTQLPHAGLALAMHGWAKGDSLATTLERSDLGVGDFVRWSKQTIDLLDQIAQASLSVDAASPMAALARDAKLLVRRGIVEASSTS
ncbi:MULTISPECIES: DEAD/DEAH box helicase [unclassified Leucobacter]|uniref:DEAD/DEAH box helicase n=1 Tax=unclassified Leucobacter TaxID=2621730 RepID=UPI00165E4CB8|nr:DEAD/DEAH box helicase [Leucobacter sp. cx-87]